MCRGGMLHWKRRMSSQSNAAAAGPLPRCSPVAPTVCALPAQNINVLTLYLPAQNINVLTLGSPTGTGVFFPNGLNGVIKYPTGYNLTDPGTASFYKAVPSGQVRRAAAPCGGMLGAPLLCAQSCHCRGFGYL